MLKRLRQAAWLAIFAGMAVSAARVVMALDAQAFDRVASAGLPAVLGLLGGALVLGVTSALEDAAGTGALGQNLFRDLCPTQPASVIGLALLLGGIAWIAFTYWTLDDPSVRAWAILPASMGGLAVLLGVILMLVAALRGPRRR